MRRKRLIRHFITTPVWEDGVSASWSKQYRMCYMREVGGLLKKFWRAFDAASDEEAERITDDLRALLRGAKIGHAHAEARRIFERPWKRKETRRRLGARICRWANRPGYIARFYNVLLGRRVLAGFHTGDKAAAARLAFEVDKLTAGLSEKGVSKQLRDPRYIANAARVRKLAEQSGVSQKAIRIYFGCLSKKRTGRPLNPENIKLGKMAWALHEQGKSWNEIAKALGRNYSAARQLASRYGKPPKTAPRPRISYISQKHPYTCQQLWPFKQAICRLPDVAEHLSRVLGKSKRTIKDWSAKHNWRNSVPQPYKRIVVVSREMLLRTLKKLGVKVARSKTLTSPRGRRKGGGR